MITDFIFATLTFQLKTIYIIKSLFNLILVMNLRFSAI